MKGRLAMKGIGHILKTGTAAAFFFCCLAILFPLSARADYLTNDEEELAKVASGGNSAFYSSREKIISQAEKTLQQDIPVITDKVTVPPSGDKRDYTSLAIYYWPDENTETGLPYVNRDGYVNPEKDDLDKYDSRRLERICTELRSLCRGYAVSGREDFAARAVQILDTWFISPETRMNPNLEYAQEVPGKSTGGKSGIIDTVKLIEVTDDLKMIEKSASYSAEKQTAVKKWFGEYADWLTESKNGKKEALSVNNHGTWYDAQTAAFYLYAGHADKVREIIKAVPEKRMEGQIMADGSMPYELARTRPMSYSLYNLQAFLTLARLGEETGVNLYDAVNSAGAGIGTAVYYLLPYVRGDEVMEKTDVTAWSPNAFIAMLHTANKFYRNPDFELK
jgi:hypothetical protein